MDIDINSTITIKEIAKNASKAIKSREGADIFDLSFSMSLLTGIPKEDCVDMIIRAHREEEKKFKNKS